mmetsp:Transcript_3603/g.12407  ORF Transcript_3603/g.12407 Transcript_3603/m.12407 type:complete len:102 (+) Transcript_3603:55-360(+)
MMRAFRALLLLVIAVAMTAAFAPPARAPLASRGVHSPRMADKPQQEEGMDLTLEDMFDVFEKADKAIPDDKKPASGGSGKSALQDAFEKLMGGAPKKEGGN